MAGRSILGTLQAGLLLMAMLVPTKLRGVEAIAGGGTRLTQSDDVATQADHSLSDADWAELTEYGCPTHDAMVARVKEINRRAATDPDWCMLFYHIPKTAGTTLRSLWTSNHLQTSTYGYDFWKSQSVVDRRFLSTVRHATAFGDSFQVLQGHFGYGMKPLMREISQFMTRSAAKRREVNGTLKAKVFAPLGQQCFEGTMLREPIARVISAFFFHQQYKHRDVSKPDAWRECLRDKNFTRMFLNGTNFQSDPDGLCFEYSNDDVKWLSGKFTMRVHRVMAAGKSTFGSDGHALPKHLELAKRNLCKMDFVLMQSQMEQSIGTLASTLNLNSMIKNHLWENKAKKVKKGDITPEIQSILEESNQLDLALHLFATKVYKARQIAAKEAMPAGRGSLNE